MNEGTGVVERVPLGRITLLPNGTDFEIPEMAAGPAASREQMTAPATDSNMTRDANPLDLDRLLSQQDFVRSICRRLLQTDADVDDAAQEAWIKSSAASPRSGAARRGWLAAIARNAVLSLRRRDEARTRREERTATAAAAPSPDEILAREELRRRVVRAVLDLPEDYRMVILLRHFEELAPDEIAARLAIPIATLRTRLHRAHERLRRRLAADDPHRRRLLLVLAAPPSKTVAITTGAMLMKVALTILAAVLVLAAVWLGAAGWLDPAESRRDVPTTIATGPPEDAAPTVEPSATTRTPEVARAVATAEPDPIDPTGRWIEGTATDEADRPVAGARVRLLRSGTLDRIAATTTDVDGSFAIAFSFGPAELVVEADGFIPASSSRVAPGERHDVVLRRGIVVRGRVIDAATEAPVADAKVRIGVTAIQTTSDDDGTFTLCLPPFVASLDVDVDDSYGRWSRSPFLPAQYGEIVVPLAPARANAMVFLRVVDDSSGAPVALASAWPGPTEGLGDDLHRVGAIRGASGDLARVLAQGFLETIVDVPAGRGRTRDDAVEVRLARAAQITGRVRAAGGRPVAAATVHARSRIQNPIAGRSVVGAWWKRTVTADEAGRFTLDGALPLSRYDVTARAPAFATRTVDVSPTADGADVAIDLAPGRTLEGVVVGDEDGAPVPRATVLVGREPVAVSDDDGRFRVEDLPATIDLEVFGPGSLRSVHSGLSVPDEPLRVPLVAGGTVAGRVVDRSGAAVPFAVVAAQVHRPVDRAERDDGWTIHGPNPPPPATADAAGGFTLVALVPGDVYVAATRYAPAPRPGRYDEAVIPTGATDAVIVVREPTGLALRIVDAVTGRPIPRARRFVNAGTLARFALEDNTHASFFEPLPPGLALSYGAEAAGYAPMRIDDVALEPGEVRDATLALRPALALRGWLRDAHDVPVAGATFLLRPGGADDDRLDVNVTTGPDGRFVIEDLGPGAWDVVRPVVPDRDGALERGIVVEPTPIELAVDEANEVWLTARFVEGRATVRGIVPPLVGAERTIVHLSSGSIRVEADPEGRFVATRVPPGTCEVSATWHRRIGTVFDSIGTIDVPEDGLLDVDLRSETGRR